MESPKRKNNRLPNYDYGSEGCYFVTICIKDRRPILSDFVGVDVLGDPQRIKLLPYGIIADKYINQINEFYVNINVDKYVIMPDHIHMIIKIVNCSTWEDSLSARELSRSDRARRICQIDPYKNGFIGCAFIKNINHKGNRKINFSTFLQRPHNSRRARLY